MTQPRTVAVLLAEQALGLDDLERRTALERRVLQAIVEGRWTPSPSQRQRLAAALGVAVADIVWGHTVEVSHLHGHGPQFGRTP